MADTLKCETCGKEFKNNRALQVHIGMIHGEKPAGIDLKPAKKKKKKKKSKAGIVKKAWTCELCGKTFGMAAHLARHMIGHRKIAEAETAQPRKARKKAKPVRRQAAAVVAPIAAASSGIDVRALTVDQLLTLKSEVDARLADIVKQMRAANVAL
jgi:ribosomal protein S27AE